MSRGSAQQSLFDLYSKIYKERIKTMNNIYDCVQAYSSLLHMEYNLVIGRKGNNITFKIQFDKKDCFHLMGLQYLTDRPELSSDRGKIFDKIIKHNISLKQVETSAFYKKIEKRVDMLPYLKLLLDSNEMIFKYNQKNNQLSLIRAEYLLSTPYYVNDKLENEIYIFLDKNQSTGCYFCRSFFPKDKKDYTTGQTSYTLLYKEKINTVTGKTEVQYNKLYDYRMVSLKEVEILKNSGLPFVMKKADENRGIIRFEKRNAVKVNALIGPPSQLELGTKPPNRNNPKR